MTTAVFIENALNKRAAQKRRDYFETYRRRLVESVDGELDVAAMDELLEAAGELGFDKKKIDADTKMVQRVRVLESRTTKAGGPEGMKRENEKTESLAREIETAKARVRELEKQHLNQYHARRALGLELSELGRYQNDPIFTGNFELPADKRLKPVDSKDVPGRRPTARDLAHARTDDGRHRGGLPQRKDR